MKISLPRHLAAQQNRQPQVLNLYKNPDAKTRSDCVYIGRPSKWGNPFAIGKDGTREEVIEKYRQHLFERPELLEQAKKELAGKNLVCFCAPKACHGNILIEIANPTLAKSESESRD